MKSVARVDARRKAEGRTLYTDDYKIPGLWYGAILWSPVSRGRIRELSLPTGDDVVLVSARDIPGANIVPEPVSDEPFFAPDEVFYRGQPLAAVACPDRSQLRRWLSQVLLKIDELPAQVDPDAILEDETNVFGHVITVDHGPHLAPNPTWLHSHAVYRTTHQEQLYLEPQSLTAHFDAASRIMHMQGSMQCPYFVKEGVEAIMGNAVTEVVVEVAEGVGGGFGGKEDFPSLLGGIAALLSYRAGHPVRVVLDRAEDIAYTTKRHPARIEIDSWVDPATRRIEKMDVDYRLDAGYYQTLSPVVLSRGALHAGGAYHHRDTRVVARLLRSHTPPNGAFRGFGAPQALYAVEAHIDDVAQNLGIDPAELRRTNICRVGSVFPSTQVIHENHLADAFEEVLTWSEYAAKRARFTEYDRLHPDKKGIGLAIGMHGGGYTGNGEKVLDSEVKVRIETDGSVHIFVSNVEMGQGCNTTLSQMFADALGYPLRLTRVERPDTSKTPNSGPTVASRTIYIVGGILRTLAAKIKEELHGETLAEVLRNHPETFPREYRQRFVPDPTVVFDTDTYRGMGYKDYSWAACVAEVSYDPMEYRLTVNDLWVVADIGEPVNPAVAEGQMQGGMAQAVGYAVSEWIFKPGLGRLSGLTDYGAPLSTDVPRMHVRFIHTDSAVAKGLGELPMDFPAPAIRNALLHALGTAPNRIPLTPECLQSEGGGE